MINLQIAALYARRLGFGVACLGFVVVTAAMAGAGWLDTLHGQMYAGWIEVAAWMLIELSLLAAGENQRGQMLAALGKLREYLYAGMVAMMCAVLPLIIFWSTVIGVNGAGLRGALVMGLTMGIFCLITGQAIQGNLMPRTVHLVESQKVALILVMGIPWIVPAWMLGILTTGMVLGQGEEWWRPLIGMALLGIMQGAVGLISQGNDAQQNHPDPKECVPAAVLDAQENPDVGSVT